jgi:hypothetical protein
MFHSTSDVTWVGTARVAIVQPRGQRAPPLSDNIRTVDLREQALRLRRLIGRKLTAAGS